MNNMNINRSGQTIASITIPCFLLLCFNCNQATGKTLIFPIPQQIQVTKSNFVPDETVTVIIPAEMSKNDLSLARFLAKECSDRSGIELKIEKCADIPKDRKVVIMRRFDNALVNQYCKANNLEVSEKSPGPENTAYFRRFLRDFMSMYKYNKVIIELPCMRLDKHPELNTGWTAFAKYMHYCRSNDVPGKNGGYKNSPNVDAGDGYIIEKSDVGI
jgi:hypothetical protein